MSKTNEVSPRSELNTLLTQEVEGKTNNNNSVEKQMPTIVINKFAIVDSESSSSDSIHIDYGEDNKYKVIRIKSSQDKLLSSPPKEDLSSASVTTGSESAPIFFSKLNEKQEEERKLIEDNIFLESNNTEISFHTPSRSQEGKEEPEDTSLDNLNKLPESNNFFDSKEDYREIVNFKNSPIEIPYAVKTSFNTKQIREKNNNHLAELYYKGVKRRKKLEEEWESIRNARENEFKNCSFKPKITKRAKALQRSRSFSESRTLENRLRQRFILESWKSDTSKECRSIPLISKGSKDIIRRVRGNSAPVIPVEERLHFDSARRRCQRQEEEGKHQIPVITRTLEDVKAHVDTLFAFETKRQLTLEKLREEKYLSFSQGSIHVSSNEVVKRLIQNSQKVKCDHLENEKILFVPKLNPTTEELTLRARKRKLEQWYNFCTEQHNSCFTPQSTVVEKIFEILRQANLSNNFTLDEFCNTLNNYEKIHGVQLWHSVLPPSEPHINEDLTFVPKINNYKKRDKISESTNQRLFYEAKTKQKASRERERIEEEIAITEEQKRKKKLHSLMSRKRKINENKKNNISYQDSLDNLNLKEDSKIISDSESSFSSQKSASIGDDQIISKLNSENARFSYSKILDVADDLRKLIDSTEVVDNHSSSPISSNHENSPFEISKSEPIAIVMPNSEVINYISRNLKENKKKRRKSTNFQVSTDLLLECGLSRFTWSANVDTRRREQYENRRRLQELGKVLYGKM